MMSPLSAFIKLFKPAPVVESLVPAFRTMHGDHQIYKYKKYLYWAEQNPAGGAPVKSFKVLRFQNAPPTICYDFIVAETDKLAIAAAIDMLKSARAEL